MYDQEIETAIKKLPEDAKKEVLDFIEFLKKKLTSKKGENSVNEGNKFTKNPLLDISGFCEIGEMDSSQIDSEVYGT